MTRTPSEPALEECEGLQLVVDILAVPPDLLCLHPVINASTDRVGLLPPITVFQGRLIAPHGRTGVRHEVVEEVLALRTQGSVISQPVQVLFCFFHLPTDDGVLQGVGKVSEQWTTDLRVATSPCLRADR